MLTKDEFYNRVIKLSTIVNNYWLYQGFLRGGYGRITIKGITYDVHRIFAHLYHELNLENSKELSLHKCSNRNCWNPEHLYKGDHFRNSQDALIFGNLKCHNRNKTHCQDGHEFTKENTIKTIRGTRQCRICKSLKRKQYYQENNR